jgi:peptide/nickel transport system permease protein
MRIKMGLRAYIIKRTIYSIFLLFFVITINFIIFELMPGNPIEFFAAAGKLKDPQQVEEVLASFGLNEPLHIRYLKYVRNMLTWQFGYSYGPSHEAVAEGIMKRLPNTIILVGGSTILSIIIGVILGVVAAHKRGRPIDDILVISSLTTYSFPSFWLGMVLLLIFHYHLKWFPSAGSMPLEWAVKPPPNIFVAISGRLYHLFLPLLTLTIFSYGGFLLLTRSVMLEALTEDYIITARAKGAKERTVLFRHALKNASLPLITNVALSFAFILTGAIITEQVFTYPGLGKYLWDAILFSDYPVLQAMFYIVALSVIIANFVADLMYGVVDPRIKYG